MIVPIINSILSSFVNLYFNILKNNKIYSRPLNITGRNKEKTPINHSIIF